MRSADPTAPLNKRTTFKIEGNEMKQSLQNTNEVIDKLNLSDDKIKSGLASVNDCVGELRNILFNPISTGGGVFHPMPSKWLRTPQRNKLAP